MQNLPMGICYGALFQRPSIARPSTVFKVIDTISQKKHNRLRSIEPKPYPSHPALTTPPNNFARLVISAEAPLFELKAMCVLARTLFRRIIGWVNSHPIELGCAQKALNSSTSLGNGGPAPRLAASSNRP